MYFVYYLCFKLIGIIKVILLNKIVSYTVLSKDLNHFIGVCLTGRRFIIAIKYRTGIRDTFLIYVNEVRDDNGYDHIDTCHCLLILSSSLMQQ